MWRCIYSTSEYQAVFRPNAQSEFPLLFQEFGVLQRVFVKTIVSHSPLSFNDIVVGDVRALQQFIENNTRDDTTINVNTYRTYVMRI